MPQYKLSISQIQEQKMMLQFLDHEYNPKQGSQT